MSFGKMNTFISIVEKQFTQDDEGTVVQAEKTPNLLDRIWQVLQSLFS